MIATTRVCGAPRPPGDAPRARLTKPYKRQRRTVPLPPTHTLQSRIAPPPIEISRLRQRDQVPLKMGLDFTRRAQDGGLHQRVGHLGLGVAFLDPWGPPRHSDTHSSLRHCIESAPFDYSRCCRLNLSIGHRFARDRALVKKLYRGRPAVGASSIRESCSGTNCSLTRKLFHSDYVWSCHSASTTALRRLSQGTLLSDDRGV